MNSVRKSDLRRHIELRLGKGSEVEQMQKMFKKSFQAKSFREFWWYWNPAYGFFLGKYIYKPLRTFLPQSISVIFTFLACGLFLHDLPVMLLVFLIKGLLFLFPITIFFTILGLINVISAKFKLSFDQIKPHGRIAIHSFILVASLITALKITKIILVLQIN